MVEQIYGVKLSVDLNITNLPESLLIGPTFLMNVLYYRKMLTSTNYFISPLLF